MSAPAQSSLPVTTASPSKVRIADYAVVTALLTAYCVGLAFLTGAQQAPNPTPERLLRPIEALVALTAFVWLLMVGVRNTTILMGITKPGYYHDYLSDQPPEWVERPAHVFNNLFQVPVLFYVVCLLMMVTGRLDETQITLAWVYVAMRLLHAVIYLGWNYVPYRFASWVASCITLGVIWWRFAF